MTWRNLSGLPSRYASIKTTMEGSSIMDPLGTELGAREKLSVTSSLDRYEPLHEVARALIDYLASTYDVTLD